MLTFSTCRALSRTKCVFFSTDLTLQRHHPTHQKAHSTRLQIILLQVHSTLQVLQITVSRAQRILQRVLRTLTPQRRSHQETRKRSVGRTSKGQGPTYLLSILLVYNSNLFLRIFLRMNFQYC